MLTACRASAPPPSSFLRAYSVPIQRQFEMFIRGSIALARRQIQAPAPWFKGQSNAEQRAALRHVTKQGARLVPLNPRSRSACQIADQVCTADDPIWVANVNSATQTVFSGTSTALQKAADAAGQAGASNCERLDVSVASHCPKQQDTARELAAHLAGLPRREPTARYLTNTRGRATMSAETVFDDLAQAIAHPVQWYDATRLMGELGATCAIEAPPGRVLTRLMSPAAPHGSRDLSRGHRPCGWRWAGAPDPG